MEVTTYRKEKGERNGSIGFNPNEHIVCSDHFLDEDYTARYSGLTEQKMQQHLRKDEVGICLFPCKHASGVCSEETPAETQRSKRKVRYYVQRACQSELMFIGNKRLSFIFTYVCQDYTPPNVIPFVSSIYFRGRKMRWKIWVPMSAKVTFRPN